LLRGPHIFFKCGKAGEQMRAGGSTLAGGPGTHGPPPPRRYGAAQLQTLSIFCIHNIINKLCLKSTYPDNEITII